MTSVLIVEDEAALAEPLAFLLKKEGFEVRIAGALAGGLLGLRQPAAHPPGTGAGGDLIAEIADEPVLLDRRQPQARLLAAEELDIDLRQDLCVEERAVLGAAGIVYLITRAELVELVEQRRHLDHGADLDPLRQQGALRLGARELVGDAGMEPVRGQVVYLEQVGVDRWWIDDSALDLGVTIYSARPADHRGQSGARDACLQRLAADRIGKLLPLAQPFAQQKMM